MSYFPLFHPSCSFSSLCPFSSLLISSPVSSSLQVLPFYSSFIQFPFILFFPPPPFLFLTILLSLLLPFYLFISRFPPGIVLLFSSLPCPSFSLSFSFVWHFLLPLLFHLFSFLASHSLASLLPFLFQCIYEVITCGGSDKYSFHSLRCFYDLNMSERFFIPFFHHSQRKEMCDRGRMCYYRHVFHLRIMFSKRR